MLSFRARLLIAAAALLCAAPPPAAALPPGFFGIGPQTPLTAADTSRMRSGGIESVRIPVISSTIQRRPDPVYDWGGTDQAVAAAATAHLRVLPFLLGTPSWLGRPTALPISSGRQRQAWSAFLTAAVQRYGPGGAFWDEHGPGSAEPLPADPIRSWQIWNEPNFFYFARPVSPGRYGRLLKISHRAIARGDRGATTIVGGLFGNPKQNPPLGMDAADFLQRLYRVHGVKAAFDGIALHPYAANTAALRRLTEAVRAVAVRNRDRRAGLYVTEMGWGSQRDPRKVAFEVGLRQQARELRAAYRYLIGNRHRLNLKQVYWFSWKDIRGDCNFCDSVGLFRRGAKFRPKPAWHAFVHVAHGHLR